MKKQALICGYNISYYEAGNGKYALVFLHGNSLCADIFLKQLNDAALKSRYRLIAPDFLGHGESDKAGQNKKDYHLHNQAKIINALIAHLQLTHVILLGHSLGGNIAIEVLRSNTQIEALVLICSFPASNPFNKRIFKNTPAIQYFFQSTLSSEDIHKMNDLLLSKANTNSKSKLFTASIKKSDAFCRKTLAQIISEGNYMDQQEFMKTIDIPVIGIFGERDQFYDLAYLQRHCSSLFTNLFVVATAGHMPFYETPLKFSQLLLNEVGQLVAQDKINTLHSKNE
ncbi:alpha/beta fold hydrolase [Carboxylicivirga taeanensis]|uniref:alpha/beta fold hydrolase n=1 Tax=Carboxylicivirga taeanensis TaxID=1416875 RepID=UPI003F6DE54A